MSDNKYSRHVWNRSQSVGIAIDVYDVLEAFDVRCPAMAHAAKKVLCAGIRGTKTAEQDIQEAIQALQRALELERGRKT